MAQQDDIFSDEDIRQIERHGLTIAEVNRQLDLFKGAAPYLRLVRPCTTGDGIRVIDGKEMTALEQIYEKAGAAQRCLKFVPASGAASRMFKTLLAALHDKGGIRRETVEKMAREGRKDQQDLLDFMNGIRRFAFFNDLKATLSARGLDMEALMEEGEFGEIVRFLLTEVGLGYAGLPKGLLKFHEYPEGSRTAFEEHLVEAVFYVKNKENRCPLHFTVSPEHMEKFRALLDAAGPLYEKKHGCCFDVGFSIQDPSTDTIAVDLMNRPFRDERGRLVFRPGGHGALIRNVNRLDADIVFIKNIDNVVPDRLKAETFRWKKILAGYLIRVQDRIFGYLEKLAAGDADDSTTAEAMAFMGDTLGFRVPDTVRDASADQKRAFITEKLNRPVRVCGMVKNVGEPGGGPFWVRDDAGELSVQIVETAQVDPDSREQQGILRSSTHFNPVDLVCGIRDRQGKPFDLLRYTDEKAVFISRKSKDGKDLKALERPGLWNGAMAGWISLFVEVPIITFNPVKTVNDLLRREHQPE